MQHGVNVEDALSKGLLDFGQADGGADVDGKIAGLVPEGEQRLHCAEPSRLGRRRQAHQRVLEGLHVTQRHRVQRALHVGEECGKVGRIGALRAGAAPVQPERREVPVAAGLLGRQRRQLGQGARRVRRRQGDDGTVHAAEPTYLRIVSSSAR